VRSLPLFHRVTGQPVVVLGAGPAADAKRRLVERAGGVVEADAQTGIDRGARLAFVALDDPAAAEAAAVRLRRAGLLVNVVDRPELCDFTTPSVLDRDPVLVAVGTGGASAGLAKQLRLRLEGVLPSSLGKLAEALHVAREALRQRWPKADDRRRALDSALGQGGALDPLDQSSAGRVEAWLQDPAGPADPEPVSLIITSNDPDDLTLRQARLLGMADCVMFGPGIAPAILTRARADAVRLALPHNGPIPEGLVVSLKRAD